MGIKGLFTFLKKQQFEFPKVNIKVYHGATAGQIRKRKTILILVYFEYIKYINKLIAVDTYGWIYKGAYFCAEDLALGKHTSK